MLLINDRQIKTNHFPDGTIAFDKNIYDIYLDEVFTSEIFPVISWHFESNEEMVILMYLVGYLKSHGCETIDLVMPYIPNARMDRVKSEDDVFTLKYFCEFINSLGFRNVIVLDPHSHVSEALINNIIVKDPDGYIIKAIRMIGKNHPNISKDDWMFFYPDEGAMKRYSSNSLGNKYAFGIKKRDWNTGKIEGLDIAGCTEDIDGKIIVIVDDICSRGGTFYHSAKKLKELGAKEIYLYVTHCENTILEGELLESGLIEKVYTTNSIFTKQHEKIEIIELERIGRL